MKKLLSVFLALSMIFTLCAPAFSFSDECDCGMTPVVYVVGFGDPIYSDVENEISAFPPDGSAIVSALPSLLTAVFAGLLIGNNDVFGKYAAKAANEILGDLALNSDGTAPENTGIEEQYPLFIDTHRVPAFGENDYEMSGGYFKFHYDWRLSPLYNAELLNDYIEEVKELTSHSKIVLAAHSQGNTIVTSYLHLYGSESIEKLVHLSPAYQGLSLIGSLYTREIDVDGKGEALGIFLEGIMGEDNGVVSLVSFLNKIGFLNGILGWLQGVLDSQLDIVFEESLIDIFGTMPGLWAFVPAEDYEQAKEMMFGDNEKYDAVAELTDYYYENVQTKTVDILKKAQADGVEIIIFSGYNISTIPITSYEASHGDLLIDTKYMTLGATCSNINSTLGDGYVQAKTDCGHNHISPENYIDASTCAFPEYTWFIKGNGHNDFGDEYSELIEWAIRYDGQPTVHSDEAYPQFVEVTESGIAAVK